MRSKPQLYPVRDIPRARRADHVDCDDGACGVCDFCLHVQFAFRVDHPSELSVEDVGRLCEVSW